MRARTTLMLFSALTLLATPAQADPKREAQAAADQWLGLIDSGDIPASWDNAASLFKQAVTKRAWSDALSAARKPFGQFVSRELISATATKSLPGAPDGDYVVLQYRAVYERKQAAIETVTPMKDGGTWKVAGYFIK